MKPVKLIPREANKIIAVTVFLFFTINSFTQAQDSSLYYSYFYSDNAKICIGSCIQFIDKTEHSPKTWSWTFNGETPSSFIGQNPPKVCYNTTGVFSVSLYTTSDYHGYSCGTYTSFVQVQDCTFPLANFTTSAYNICHGDCIYFTNTSVSADSFAWSIEKGPHKVRYDSIEFTKPSPSNICFDSAGNYKIKMMAYSSKGVDSTGTWIQVDTCISISTGITKFGAISSLEDNLIVSPKPCTTCKIRGVENVNDIIVTDLLGKTLNASFTKTSQGFSIQLPNTPTGIYFVKNIRTGEAGKFVKD